MDIGIDSMSPFARLNTLPSVSSYIGADIVAGTYVAIEEIKICKNEISLEVIGNTKPIGLCGSGILAAIREMLVCGLINERGNIIKLDTIELEDFRQKYIVVENNKRFVKITEDIRITQGDIRQVQLAKSAILSGFMNLPRTPVASVVG